VVGHGADGPSIGPARPVIRWPLRHGLAVLPEPPASSAWMPARGSSPLAPAPRTGASWTGPNGACARARAPRPHPEI